MVAGSGLVAGWWSTLDEFVGRADRVLSSSIAQRQDLATVGTTMNLIASLSEGGTSWRIEYGYPPEADIESAATRVRPLFLNDDPIFHGKVTNAMGGLAQGAPQLQQELVKVLKKSWQAHDKGYRWAFATSKNPHLAGAWRNDRQIARDFLYGELVHADADARRRLRYVPESERLQAAVVWVADAIRLTQATKQLYVDLKDGQYLTKRPG